MGYQGPLFCDLQLLKPLSNFEIDYQLENASLSRSKSNDFPYSTVYLINRRQEPGHHFSTSPLVIVQNFDEQRAGSPLSDKMCDVYWSIRDRQEEPWSKIEIISKQIEASAMNKMWAAIGLVCRTR